MMSNKVKKVLAVVLAMVMVMGMSITSYAAGETSGTGTGEGTFEGSVDKEIISVTLPTTDETTFDFILDPEGLIAATSKAKYPDATFEEGANVFFQSADKVYTDESASLKVINKGTVDVDITVSASVDADAAIDYDAETMGGEKLSALTESVGAKVVMATGDTDELVKVSDLPMLYLGLQVANQTAEAVKTSDDETTPAEVAVGVRGKADNYEVTYSAENGYKFTVKSGVAETAWNSMEFNLVGKCNTEGDWSTNALAAPTVTLTWSYAERTGETNPLLDENAVLVQDVGPTLDETGTTEASYTLTADNELAINVSEGTGNMKEAYSGATFVITGGTEYIDLVTEFATYEEGTFTIKPVCVNYFIRNNGGTVKLAFDKGTVLTVNLVTE